MPVTIEVGVTKYGNQEQTLKRSEKVVFCQIRADAQKYGHRPQYRANNDITVITVCAQKCQVPARLSLLPQRYGQQGEE